MIRLTAQSIRFSSTSQRSPDASIFSKHGGKMLFSFLGFLGGWIYRASKNSSKLHALKEEVDNSSPISPEEVEDLRCDNDFPSSLFPVIWRRAAAHFPDRNVSYPNFVNEISDLLPHPLVHGYILDRAIFGSRKWALKDDKFFNDYSDESSCPGSDLFDIDIILAAFSISINTTVDERISHMWAMISKEEANQSDALLFGRVSRLVDILLATRQIPSQKYYVKAEKHWPFQEYKLATGDALVLNALNEINEKENRKEKGWIERKITLKKSNLEDLQINYDTFVEIMTSNSVCAWGECFPSAISKK